MKFAVSLPYGERVFDHDDAMLLIEILERSEVMETKYRSKEDGGSLYYVSTPDDRGITLKHIPDNQYQIAKMAGPKPD